MRIFPPMTIRTRILAFQLIVGTAVIVLIVAAFLAIQAFHFHLSRGALAHRQLAAVTALARDVDHYSRALAALLMTGKPAAGEVVRLQTGIGAAFETLSETTRDETAFLGSRGDAHGQAEEAVRIGRLKSLYDDMNRRGEALLAMQKVGQGEAAARVFFRTIDRRADEEFSALIDAAMADEIAEIEMADSEARELLGRLGWGIGLVSAVLLSAALIAGYVLHRSLARPIRRLSAGAEAIGRGELSFRLGPLGDDEIGVFARRFDDMATRIEEQQAQLLQAQAGLEAEVAARTRELEGANSALRERDRSRVRFLADVSHELRAPLTVLRGEAEVTLRSKPLQLADCREALIRVVEEAEAMGRLVEDLMVLARSETDEVALAADPVDLAEILGDAVREAASLARPRAIRIEPEISAAPIVIGDRSRLKQVLMILLDNAVKYSEHGEIVRLRLGYSEGVAELVVVNRSGPIAEEELPRLFDRFYRGREAAMAGSAGSGLGLAIARWLVEKHDGTIALGRDGPDRLKVLLRLPAAALELDTTASALANEARETNDRTPAYLPAAE
ncbi:signal transduction histidine kinase [Rhodopseudomonas julia]|uniref:histidine kinase n=1 Tax=Rhodopseudomonas julia TaxID=200617 RepID=A0ABU0CAP2_9BRAD|nr:HAMP domain-containing sensor histidine kinase [Rhodopseudomonas julia]MDQ0327600.1 signal transduction histidine kinase [Rhodopseudomonas julia]